MLKILDGIPVDNGANDEGDSACRWGLLQWADFTAEPMCQPERFMTGWGLCRRSPRQVPWDNPYNFTRDQLVPFVAGLWALGRQDLIRQIFWRHASRLFFCQNFERDAVGTTKYPWPHKFVDDDGKTKWRLFDFADPLLPDVIWYLIRAANLWPLYPFALIGVPWFIFSLSLHAKSEHKEHNQVICQAAICGPYFIRNFVEMVPQWREDLRAYWSGWRNQPEISELIIYKVESIT